MPFAQGVGLFYSDEGAGPPVVLGHGFGLTHELWREQSELNDEFRMIAYDLRGCGASSTPPVGYDYPDHMADLIGLLDHLGMQHAHLVGHGLAGGVMVHLALEHPERVASLCLVDSSLIGFPWSDDWLAPWARCAEIVAEGGSLESAREAWFDAEMFRWVRERRPEVFADVAAMTSRWARHEWRGPYPYIDPPVGDIERLAELSPPVFVLSGQEDLHDFVEIANMVSWWARGALQRSLLGVGHFPMLENPKEMNLYLRGWLRKMAGLGVSEQQNDPRWDDNARAGRPVDEVTAGGGPGPTALVDVSMKEPQAGAAEPVGTGAKEAPVSQAAVADEELSATPAEASEPPAAGEGQPASIDEAAEPPVEAVVPSAEIEDVTESAAEAGASVIVDDAIDRSFAQFGLSAPVMEAIDKMGFVEATPIQLKSLPLVLAGHDILGQAQTGTGKTAAFGIPIAERFAHDAPTVQALVLCPTRELAVQVAEEVHEICLFAGHKVLPVYGGQRIDRQITALRKGVQVVVGTPGRILDHLGRGTLKLSGVRMLVLDEADMMLDMGFLPDIRRIIRQCPQDRQTLLFSATIPDEVRRISSEYMRDPVPVSVVPETLTLEDTEQIFYEIPEDDKLDALMRLLDAEKEGSSVMIFCRTRRNVDRLTRKLKAQGYDVDGLHGDLTQQQRDRIMQDFREQKFPYLVATDVASRGLDISHVTHVINFHIPQDPEAYVHRIGRTGRMGRSGVAITFVTPAEYWDLLRIQEFSMAQIEPGELPAAVVETKERSRRRREHAAEAARGGSAPVLGRADIAPALPEPVESPAVETLSATTPSEHAEPAEEAPSRRPRRRRAGGRVGDESIIELTPAGREAIIELTPRGMEVVAGIPVEEAAGEEVASAAVVEPGEETTEAERRQRRYAERDARRRIERAPAEEVSRESSRIEHEQLLDAIQRQAWAASDEGAAAAESATREQEAAVEARELARRDRQAEVEERLNRARAGEAAAPVPLEYLIEPEEEARIQWGLGLLRRAQGILGALDERQIRDYMAVADRLLVDHEARVLAAALLHDLAVREGMPPGRSEPAEMARLFVSIGRRSRVSKEELQRLVRETAGILESDIGRIDLLHNFAFIEVRKAVAAEVIDKMHESMFKGREISVAPAKPAGKTTGANEE